MAQQPSDYQVRLEALRAAVQFRQGVDPSMVNSGDQVTQTARIFERYLRSNG